MLVRTRLLSLLLLAVHILVGRLAGLQYFTRPVLVALGLRGLVPVLALLLVLGRAPVVLVLHPPLAHPHHVHGAAVGRGQHVPAVDERAAAVPERSTAPLLPPQQRHPRELPQVRRVAAAHEAAEGFDLGAAVPGLGAGHVARAAGVRGRERGGRGGGLGCCCGRLAAAHLGRPLVADQTLQPRHQLLVLAAALAQTWPQSASQNKVSG